MPTYEYECKKCAKKFELFQSITADTTMDCPNCKSKAQRLIGGGAGFIFKGSGFYATDYKKRPAPAGEGRKKEEKPPCPLNKNCKECNGPNKAV
ncbi:MAG: zinc ribbon domain-containing protein [Candidatus Omnitrophica bacterium]|nr:zinc ribbon domain-containing protein [Candidatus Omnitrophota bacterium]